MTRRVRVVLGLLILSVSIFVLLWGFLPLRRETRIRSVSTSSELALPERRSVRLSFPPALRVGDAGIVRLTMDVGDPGRITSSAEAGGNDVSADHAQTPNLYDANKVISEARFDIPGMDVRPTELISAPISEGQTPVFYWTLRPRQAGNFRGTIWLYLRTVDRETGLESRETISAQIVEINSNKLFGLSANQARMLGLVGATVGLFLSLPFFGALAKTLIEKRSRIT